MHRQYVRVSSIKGNLKLYNEDPEDFIVDWEKLAVLVPNFDAKSEIVFDLALGCDDCGTDICLEVVIEFLPSDEELEPGESPKAHILKNIVYDVLDQIAESEETDYPDFAMLVDPDELAIFYAMMKNDGPIH